MTLPYGFRIVGACSEARRLVDADAAFRAYAACDERAAAEREGFLSAFTFGEDFRELLESTGSCRGFAGVCWSPWLWFDIDREDDLDDALRDARRLASFLADRYALDDDSLLVFYSGAKGLHLGLPTGLFAPDPSASFHAAARRLAERLTEECGVDIDRGVYDRVRAFRAPNSRHPRTGLHKRRLALDELMGLSIDRIRDLARRPEPFDVPPPPPPIAQATTDWRDALATVQTESEAKARLHVAGAERTALNRSTLEFIRDGASEGERHSRLFQAAANLAEFGCPGPLAHALLSEAALDSGLPPAEVRRQIECGLAHVGPPPAVETSKSPVVAATAPDLKDRLAALWRADSTPPPAEAGDAWEHPGDRLAFAPVDADAGPYGTKGGRQ